MKNASDFFTQISRKFHANFTQNFTHNFTDVSMTVFIYVFAQHSPAMAWCHTRIVWHLLCFARNSEHLRGCAGARFKVAR